MNNEVYEEYKKCFEASQAGEWKLHQLIRDREDLLAEAKPLAISPREKVSEWNGEAITKLRSKVETFCLFEWL